MHLYAICPKCELPVMGRVTEPTLCPHCHVPLDPADCTEDNFFNFLEDLKNQSYFEWDDIQHLIYACDLLGEMNNSLSMELAKTLKQLHKMNKRIEFYQKANELHLAT